MFNIFQIRKSGILWVVLTIMCFAQACKTTKALEVEHTSTAEFENALLWQIDGKDLETPSYLFGTIHLIDADQFFWPEGTLAAFESSELIVFEVDMDDMFDITTQMSLLSKAFMNDNQKLADFYTDEEYTEVKDHFDELGIPMFFLERIKPMFLTVFASGDIDLAGGLDGQSSVTSYEMELYNLSKETNKSVEGLETLEFQISVFDSIPYDAQAKMLLETVRATNTEDNAVQELIEMYKNQEINRMVAEMGEDEGIGAYEDILLYSRNKNWIPVISEKMKSGSIFFAVGAGHLAGENGVLNLLQNAGYTITPLSNKKSI